MQATSAQPTEPADREQGFRPVEGGGDQSSGGMLLTVAYSVIWLMALALILLSMRRQRQLDARIVQLSADLERARKKEGS
ncbi:MAG TPA: CcmD family protein [Polyangiaceae bacterium]|nr:CcmD family protein [Polyangiaceae bacterium]